MHTLAKATAFYQCVVISFIWFWIFYGSWLNPGAKISNEASLYVYIETDLYILDQPTKAIMHFMLRLSFVHYKFFK